MNGDSKQIVGVLLLLAAVGLAAYYFLNQPKSYCPSGQDYGTVSKACVGMDTWCKEMRGASYSWNPATNPPSCVEAAYSSEGDACGALNSNHRPCGAGLYCDNSLTGFCVKGTCTQEFGKCGVLNSAGLPCCSGLTCSSHDTGACLKQGGCSPAGNACGALNSAGQPCCEGSYCGGTIGWEYCISISPSATPTACSPAGKQCGLMNSARVPCCAGTYCGGTPLYEYCITEGFSPEGDNCGRLNSAGRSCGTGLYCSDILFGTCVRI